MASGSVAYDSAPTGSMPSGGAAGASCGCGPQPSGMARRGPSVTISDAARAKLGRALGRRWCGNGLLMTAYIPVSITGGVVSLVQPSIPIVATSSGWSDKESDGIPNFTSGTNVPTGTPVGPTESDLYPMGRVTRIDAQFVASHVRVSSLGSFRPLLGIAPHTVGGYIPMLLDDRVNLWGVIKEIVDIQFTEGQLDSCNLYTVARARDAWEAWTPVGCRTVLDGSQANNAPEQSIQVAPVYGGGSAPATMELFTFGGPAPADGAYLLPVRIELAGLLDLRSLA